jgi:hypothetical protein
LDKNTVINYHLGSDSIYIHYTISIGPQALL